MKISEMIARDRKQLAKLKGKDRLIFLWDYYKGLILCFLFVFFILLTFLISNIGRKDVSMYVVLLNNDSLISECDRDIFDKTLQAAGYDTSKKKVNVNTDYSLGLSENESDDIETLQVLTALFTISDLDLYAAPKEYFDYFAENDGFMDLSALIEDQEHSDLYRYTNRNGQTIINGIILKQGSILHKAGFYHNDVIIGIVNKAVNYEAAAAFILELLKDES